VAVKPDNSTKSSFIYKIDNTGFQRALEVTRVTVVEGTRLSAASIPDDTAIQTPDSNAQDAGTLSIASSENFFI
jgi:hypothetical protein